MTGPEKAIEGAHGLQNLVGKFELLLFGGSSTPFGITNVTIVTSWRKGMRFHRSRQPC